MKNFKTLEVGKTYRRRDGELVEIISINNSVEFYFLGSNDEQYKSNGNFYLDDSKSDYDLIEMIENKPTLAPNGQDAKPLNIESIDAEIARLQELRKELDKSVEVDEELLLQNTAICKDGRFSNKAIFLSQTYNWSIETHEDGDLVLVPTKK